MHKVLFIAATIFLFTQELQAQILLKPTRVFDGKEMHTNWVVYVENNKIIYAGPSSGFKRKGKVEVMEFPNSTLMPGMIEGHSHMLLYPYNQTPWEEQVLKESESYRVAKATVHVKNTLLAGVTTSRDLGSEGAGYADVGLKRAIENGVIPGPRLLVAGPAIVATGSYAPFGYSTEIDIHKGAQPADGTELFQVTREQMGKGADFIKIYADYRWGANGEAAPTFTVAELEIITSVAQSSGRYAVAHASTPEGMKRAILSGVETIEHGTGATEEIMALMVEHDVALCPTLAAGEAISMYRGWNKGKDPDPERVQQAKKMFKMALDYGVKILAGGDVGVYEHGENVREFLLMEEYGMDRMDVLKAITSGNAEIMHLESRLGSIKEGLLADVIVVRGDPSSQLKDLENVSLVMKDGVIYKKP